MKVKYLLHRFYHVSTDKNYKKELDLCNQLENTFEM